MVDRIHGEADAPPPGVAGAGPNGSSSDGELGRILQQAQGQLRAMGDEVSELAKLQVDRVRVGAQRAALATVLGLLGAIVGTVAAIYATIQALRGLAYGISRLFETGPWLGELVVGLLVLGGAFGGILLVRARKDKKELERLREKYEGAGAEEGR